jgi:hypothetical protein
MSTCRPDPRTVYRRVTLRNASSFATKRTGSVTCRAAEAVTAQTISATGERRRRISAPPYPYEAAPGRSALDKPKDPCSHRAPETRGATG